MFNSSEKQKEIALWVQQIRDKKNEIIVNEYSYNCLLSGRLKRKTIIIILDELETKGLISIDKPLIKIRGLDIIKHYRKIK